MKELLRRAPDGPLADDARYQLATDALFEGDLITAERYFRELRENPDENDFVDSAYYFPAIGFIGSGPRQNLAVADDLLAQYVDRYPRGPLRQHATFWRGRIAEERGNVAGARNYFEQVVDQAPYTYYGIRARMHLELGAMAKGSDVPAPGSTAQASLREARRRSIPDGVLNGDSPYHLRLEEAEKSGLYRQLREIEATFTRRLDDIPLSDLDASGSLPAVGLLLALRQDALAARDKLSTSDNRLKLAGTLGSRIGDWPTALEMIAADAESSPSVSELQKDPRYLATAYPMVYGDMLTQASWPIGGSSARSRSIMYAVMRSESYFYSRAISPIGAVGLFQFMPATFSDLDRKWRVLRASGKSSATDYLLDPRLNIDLWARWAREDLKIGRRSGIDVSLMEHQAGEGNVARWRKFWTSVGAENDVEYRIETARFPATRNFTRSVLGDVAIVDAGGLYPDSEAKQ
jgi:hypothetical protein